MKKKKNNKKNSQILSATALMAVLAANTTLGVNAQTVTDYDSFEKAFGHKQDPEGNPMSDSTVTVHNNTIPLSNTVTMDSGITVLEGSGDNSLLEGGGLIIGSGSDLSVNNLSLKDLTSGIENQGTIALEKATISGSTGLTNKGTATVKGSTVSSITNEASKSLTVQASTDGTKSSVTSITNKGTTTVSNSEVTTLTNDTGATKVTVKDGAKIGTLTNNAGEAEVIASEVTTKIDNKAGATLSVKNSGSGDTLKRSKVAAIKNAGTATVTNSEVTGDIENSKTLTVEDSSSIGSITQNDDSAQTTVTASTVGTITNTKGSVQITDTDVTTEVINEGTFTAKKGTRTKGSVVKKLTQKKGTATIQNSEATTVEVKGGKATLDGSKSTTVSVTTATGEVEIKGGSEVGTISNDGIATVDSSTVTGAITSSKTLTVKGTAQTSTISNSGTATIQGSAQTGVITNSGTLNVESGSANIAGISQSDTDATVSVSGSGFELKEAAISKGKYTTSVDTSISSGTIAKDVQVALGGTTTVTGGTLNINSGDTMGTGVSVNGGTLALDGATQGSAVIDAIAGTLDSKDTALTFNTSGKGIKGGVATSISGGSLSIGGGSVELNGSDTLAADTTLSSGSLTLGVKQTAGTFTATSGNLTLNTGGEVSVGNEKQINDSVKVNLAGGKIGVAGGNVTLDGASGKDTITSGSIAQTAGSLTASNIATASGLSLTSEGGTLSLTNVTLGNANDIITSDVAATVNGLIINNTNTDVTKGVTLTQGSDTISGNVTLTNGVLNIGGYNTAASRSGAIIANGGIFNVSSSILFNNGSDYVYKAAKAAFKDNTTFSNGHVVLDSATASADSITNGKVLTTNGSATLELDGFSTTSSTGAINADAGTVTVAGASSLGNSSDRILGDAALTVNENLTVAGGTVYLNSGDTIASGKKVQLNSGELNLSYSTASDKGYISTQGGKVTVSGDTTLNNASDLIGSSSTLDVDADLTNAGGTIELNSGDTIANGKKIKQTSGTTNIKGFATSSTGDNGALDITGGKLNIKDGALTLNAADKIGGGASVEMTKNLTIGNAGAEVTLRNTGADAGKDTLTSGTIAITAGKLILDGVDTSAAGTAAKIDADGGTVQVTGDSILNSGNTIAKEVALDVDSNLTNAGGTIELNSGDTIKSGKKIKQTSGTIDSYGFATAASGDDNGTLDISGGLLNVKSDGLSLNAADKIGDGATVNLAGNLLINNDGAEVTLTTGTGKDQLTSGTIDLDKGKLVLKGVDTSLGNAKIDADGGTVQVTAASTLVGDNIAKTVNIDADANLVIGDGTEITLNSGDTIANGAVIQEVAGGTINIEGFSTVSGEGALDIDGGTLNVKDGTLTLNSTDNIADAASVVIEKNVTIGNAGAEVTLRNTGAAAGKDTLTSGTIGITAGKLILNGVDMSQAATGAKINANGGTVQVTGDSTLNTGNSIAKEVTLDIDSNLTNAGGSIELNSGDTIASGKKIQQTSGNIDSYGFATKASGSDKGTLDIDGGQLNVKTGGLTLNAADDIAGDAVVTLDSGATLKINNSSANVTLSTKSGTGQDNLSASGSKVELAEGTLTLAGVTTTAGGTAVETTGGKAHITDDTTLVDATIGASTTVDVDANLTVGANTTLNLNSGDTIATGKKIQQTSGKIIADGFATSSTGDNGILDLDAGALEIKSGGLTLNAGASGAADNIADAVEVTVGGNLTINNQYAEVTLSGDDQLNSGTVGVNNGKLILKDVTTATTGSKFDVDGGTLQITGTSTDGTKLVAGNTVAKEAAVDVDNNLKLDGASIELDANDSIASGKTITLTSGKITADGFSTNATGDNGSLVVQGGELQIGGLTNDESPTGLTLNTAGDSIAKEAKVTVQDNLTINKGSVELNAFKADGTTQDDILTSGKITVAGTPTDGGSLTVSGFTDETLGSVTVEALGGNFTVKSGTISAYIEEASKVDIQSGATVSILGDSVLGEGDTWSGNIVVSGNNTLTLKEGYTREEGATFTANGGTTDIGVVDGASEEFVVQTGDSIGAGAVVNLNNGKLSVSGTDVSVTLNGAGAAGSIDSLNNGTVELTEGTLIMSDLATKDTVTLNATEATGKTAKLQLSNFELNNGTDVIADAVETTINNVKVSNTSTTGVTLSSDDHWTGDLAVAGGTVKLEGVDQGSTFSATGGDIYVGDTTEGKEQTLTVSGTKTVSGSAVANEIADAAQVHIAAGSGVDAKTSGVINLTDNDTWNGDAKVEANGILNLKGVSQNGTLNAVAGNLNATDTNVKVGVGSEIDSDAVTSISGGSLTITAGTDADDATDGKVYLSSTDSVSTSIVLGVDGASPVDGGELTLNNVAQNATTIDANSGILNFVQQQFTVGTGSDVAKTVQFNIDADSVVKVANGGSVYLNSSLARGAYSDADDWSGTVSLDDASEGGSITIDGVHAKTGVLKATTGGTLTVEAGGFTLNNSDDEIGLTPAVEIKGNLNVEAGKVELSGVGASGTTDKLTKGVITVDGGEISLDNLATNADNSVYLNAETGTLGLNKFELNSENDTIASAVAVTVGTDGLVINNTSNDGVTLDGGDTWTGKVTLNDGLLKLEGVTNGALDATGGELRLGAAGKKQTLNVNSGSSIADNVVVKLTNSDLNVQGGTVTLDGTGTYADTLTSGAITLTDGTLTMSNLNTIADAVSLVADSADTKTAGLNLTNVALVNDSDTIAKDVKAVVDGLTINNSNATGVTLVGGSDADSDTITGAGVTLTNGTLKVGNYKDTSRTGKIVADGGKLYVKDGEVDLNVSGDKIGKNVELHVEDDLVNKGGEINLNSDDVISPTKKIQQVTGTTNVDNFKTTSTGGSLNIEGGTLNIESNGLTLANANDTILTAATVVIDGNLNVQDGSNITIDSGDTLKSHVINQTGGTLTLKDIQTKNADATLGTAATTSVQVHSGTKTTLDNVKLGNSNDIIEYGANVEVKNGFEISAGKAQFSSDDSLDGKIAQTGGTLELDTVTTGAIAGGTNAYIQSTAGTLNAKNLTLNNASDNIGEDVTLSLTGTTAVNNGVLNINNNEGMGSRVTVGGGELILNNASQGTATVDAVSGKLTSTNTSLKFATAGEGIASAVIANLTGGSLLIDGGSVTLDKNGATDPDDVWNTATTLSSGSLTLNGVAQGANSTLKATGGALTLGSDQSLTIDANSKIDEVVTTVIQTTGTLEVDGGTVVLNGKKADGTTDDVLTSGTVKLTSGSLTVKDLATNDNAHIEGKVTDPTAAANLTLSGVTFNNANDKIDKSVTTTIAADTAATTPALTLTKGQIDLNEGDTWTGTIQLGNTATDTGVVNYEGLTNNGVIIAKGGNLNIIGAQAKDDPNYTILNVAGGSSIDNAVKVKIDGTIKINDDDIDITLDKDTDDFVYGKIELDAGKLTLDGGSGTLSTQNVSINATGGQLYMNKVLLENDNDLIDYGTEVHTNGNIDITHGTVRLDDIDKQYLTPGAIIKLDEADGAKATLGVKGFATDTTRFNLVKGTLEIGDGSGDNKGLTLNNALDVITPTITTKVMGDLTINQGKVYLNGDLTDPTKSDSWTSGTITVSGDPNDPSTFGGKLQFDNFTKTGADTLLMDNALAQVDLINNSKVIIDNAQNISDGTLNIDDDSSLTINSGNMNLTTMNTSGTLSTKSGAFENHTIETMNVVNSDFVTIDGTTQPGNGNADLTVDLYARLRNFNQQSDTLEGQTIALTDPTGTGTVNIADWSLLGNLRRKDAPIDRWYDFRILDFANVDPNIELTATDKETFTPIGYYRLFGKGDGYYRLALTRYNPQVFRGQVTTLAQYNNQLAIQDTITNHSILTAERKIAEMAQANKYAAATPNLGPYLYTQKDGGLWMKAYGDIEKLELSQALNVNNVSYGTIIGADFPVVDLKKDWKFIPTPFIAYNGAHQAFNDVSAYQNGGQAGFMGTFMRKKYISSHTLYGGGFYNEMHVDGVTDNAANWFWGTAHRFAYNWDIKRKFIIQPSWFMSYNMFGKQGFHSEFGDMGMRAGMLNGINMAPGLNLIYTKKDWSLYAGAQYMWNINEQVSGRAGSVYIPNVNMRHGYIQYGVGGSTQIKDDLSAYGQVMFRNGGRNGVAFQVGLQYYFDIHDIGQKSKEALENTKAAAREACVATKNALVNAKTATQDKITSVKANMQERKQERQQAALVKQTEKVNKLQAKEAAKDAKAQKAADAQMAKLKADKAVQQAKAQAKTAKTQQVKPVKESVKKVNDVKPAKEIKVKKENEVKTVKQVKVQANDAKKVQQAKAKKAAAKKKAPKTPKTNNARY